MKKSSHSAKLPKLIGIISLFLIVSFVFINGCTEQTQNPSDSVNPSQLVLLGKDNPAVKNAIEKQEKHTAKLMEESDILGTAVGVDEKGRPAILVYINNKSMKLSKVSANVPNEIEGVRVIKSYSEPFKAFFQKGGKPGGGGKIDTKAKQNAPIKLGTSGGWGHDYANGYCCGGTLGSLIQIGTSKYILSNYHVLAADIISGGNNKVAQTGDPVIQPGLIDINCNSANANVVATLDVSRKTLPNENIDAAIAKVVPGMVDESGAILGIGTLSKDIVAAYINQGVKKTGRTTGFSTSSVSGLNATIRVTYENECAGTEAFTKTFTGQIVIANRGSKFLAGGDSGSLMVENVSTNPRAIGLLFAGSSSTAIANPIGEVLSFYGATMVGQ